MISFFSQSLSLILLPTADTQGEGTNIREATMFSFLLVALYIAVKAHSVRLVTILRFCTEDVAGTTHL